MSKSQRIVLLFLALSILSISAMAQSSNYSVNISANKFLGSYLVNQSGFALYYYSSDGSAGGASACYGDCAKTWKPFYAEKITLPDSLNFKKELGFNLNMPATKVCDLLESRYAQRSRDGYFETDQNADEKTFVYSQIPSIFGHAPFVLIIRSKYDSITSLAWMFDGEDYDAILSFVQSLTDKGYRSIHNNRVKTGCAASLANCTLLIYKDEWTDDHDKRSKSRQTAATKLIICSKDADPLSMIDILKPVSETSHKMM